MDKSEIDPSILKQLHKLEQKYEAMGQDLSSYLDGLLHSNYLKYWEYIHLDTLLSLQTPKTNFPDENIFIIYHQITELYFKLILLEMDQTAALALSDSKEFLMHMQRINRYVRQLINSFDIMVDGMEPKQFLQFRMSLLPASGFQSAQYRLIEIGATDLYHLWAASDKPDEVDEGDVEAIYQHMYWKKGAAELSTGKRTLTLRQFEMKYDESFLKKARQRQTTNLRQQFVRHFQQSDLASEIISELRKFDVLTNIGWPLSHYKSAARYLQGDPNVIAATGGTNWQKYLPPQRQRIIFFPDLFSNEEKAEWGKAGLMKSVLDQN